MSLWIRLPWKTKNTCCKHSEWLSHVLHQALQVFPLKGDSTCSPCKSFASCADCCESALSISTFCCFLGFSELLLMR
ncbi:unnamed protein product [Sphagnum compactum]